MILLPALERFRDTDGSEPLVGLDLRAWRMQQSGVYAGGGRGEGSVRQGWTQTQAARWYGCPVSTWRSWENGKRPVPKHVGRRLVAELERQAPATFECSSCGVEKPRVERTECPLCHGSVCDSKHCWDPTMGCCLKCPGG